MDPCHIIKEFSMETLLQKYWEVKRPIYIYFNESEKAFDRVLHHKLIYKIRSLGKYLRLFLGTSYLNRRSGEERDEISINRMLGRVAFFLQISAIRT